MRGDFFKDYFYFPKRDRRAIVALGCMAVFCAGLLLMVDAWRESRQVASAIAREEATDAASAALKEKITPPIPDTSLRPFDPNAVDSLTLVGFGIKPWKVRNFLHYRAAGKVFRSAEEMGRTYGWTAEDVERVAPYVRVAARSQKEERKPSFEERKEREERVPHYESRKFQTLTKVDVNEADTAMLRRIPGIGERISEAIVRYRQRLGGFFSVAQVAEVKMVSPELLEWFTVSDAPALQQIPLNHASFQVLNSHPYITYEQTKALLQYIRLYGSVQNEQQLLSIGIFTQEEWERLKPYIAYE